MDTTIIVAIVAGLSASFLKPIVDAIINFFKRRNERKEEKEDQRDDILDRVADLEKKAVEDAIKINFCKNATHLLLKDRVTTLTQEAVKNGEISIATKAFIIQSVDLLHTDGENGEMTTCVNSIEGLRVV